METTLGHIAIIQTGIHSRTSKTGDLVYLQAKHFDEHGRLLVVLHHDLQSKDISPKHLLQPGDVLFAAKGAKNFATVYEAHNPLAVASTSFFVIRLSVKNILPNYLVWYLNSPIAQTALKAQAIGTGIPSITKHVLESLELSIPSIETQNAILKINLLRKKEKALKHAIESLREKQIQQQIINAIK